jgi:hypothetical protein
VTLAPYHSIASRSHETFHGSQKEAQTCEEKKREGKASSIQKEDGPSKGAEDSAPEDPPRDAPTQAACSTGRKAPAANAGSDRRGLA